MFRSKNSKFSLNDMTSNHCITRILKHEYMEEYILSKRSQMLSECPYIPGRELSVVPVQISESCNQEQSVFCDLAIS